MCATYQRIVHRKRQPCAITTSRIARHQRARTQRIVQVGRVHQRAVVRRAGPQTCCRARLPAAAPRLAQCAVARPVLQPTSVEAVVQSARRRRRSAPPDKRLIDALRRSSGTDRAGAMRGHTRRERLGRVAAAHLKAVATHHTLDDQPSGLEGERLQEEDRAQCSTAHGDRAGELEVAGTGEDDAALHDVVSDQDDTSCCANGCNASRHGKARRRYSTLLSDVRAESTACRRTMCAIVPAYPNELTPPEIRTSPLSSTHPCRGRCTTLILDNAASTCGLSWRSCAFGAVRPQPSCTARLSAPASPAPGSVCPAFAFRLLTAIVQPPLVLLAQQKAAASALASIGSPSAVPVP
eukprot:4929254-Prymnesium_polylepis.3